MTLRWWDDVRVLSAPKILDRFCHLHCVYRSLRWFIQEVLWLTSHKTMCFFRWIVSHLAWWNPHCWLGQATTILVASIPTKNGSKSKVFWSIDFFNSPETASSPPLERLEHHPKNSIVYVYLYIYTHVMYMYIYNIYICIIYKRNFPWNIFHSPWASPLETQNRRVPDSRWVPVRWWSTVPWDPSEVSENHWWSWDEWLTVTFFEP